MAQLRLQTLLLVLIMALASASPLAQHNESEILLGKRWYSIPLDKDASPHLPRPWPLRGHQSSVRPVRYCFANEESYQALHKDLCGGIAKWNLATRQSSLVFTTDIACGYVSRGRCMCDVPGVEPGTLRVSLSSEYTQGATRGYNEPSEEHSNLMPPNSLRFPRRRSPPAPALTDNREDRKRALLMAHELGHVIGLEHENQRPDAHNFIVFDCEALKDYSRARTMVNHVKDEPKFPPGISADSKMNLVCTDLDLAEKYFKRAFNYIPHPPSPRPWMRASDAFDYASIMLYGSDQDTSLEASRAFRFAVLKWDPRHPTTSKEMIYRGGAPGYVNAEISPMDIERVRQLYPERPVDGHDILDPQQQGQPGPRPRDTTSSKVNQPPYRVVISDVVTTTIMPAPTNVPTSLSDPKAKELLHQYLKDCGNGDACDEPEEIWLGNKRPF